MPTISVFYGIAIRMFVKDHPPPHFHAIYAEHEAEVRISDGEVIKARYREMLLSSLRNGHNSGKRH